MSSTLSKLSDAAARGSAEHTIAVLSGGSVGIDGGCGDAGRTPLMVAAQEGLSRLGARVSVADNDGATLYVCRFSTNTWPSARL